MILPLRSLKSVIFTLENLNFEGIKGVRNREITGIPCCEALKEILEFKHPLWGRGNFYLEWRNM